MLPIPDPLHPAVVHLPLALAVLMPALALLAAVAIRRQIVPPRTWGAVLLLQALLVASGWAALETGEAQEERVEGVVAERHIEQHEELAERFQLAGLVALVVVAAGLFPGAAGALARTAAVVAGLGVLATGVLVGHSGGELVYRHGAAVAYAPQGTATASAPRPYGGQDED